MNESDILSLPVYRNAWIAASLFSESMNESDTHSLLFDLVGLQTREYSHIETNVAESFPDLTGYLAAWATWAPHPSAAEEPNLSSVSQPYSSLLDDAHQQLKEIHQRAAEAYALDNEIDPVPELAYNDALSLLKMLSVCGIPMPDIGWAEDGSLGLEWRPDGGIATMGLYGDNLVIYTAFFEDKRQVEGVCALSDLPMLMGFLIMLFPPL